MSKAALFLDRDGVINVDYGYVHRPENIEFIDGIFELVAAAKKMGYLVVIVTNQAGIGRGYYSEADFHKLMNWMQARFVERCGRIDAVYFCPYHPKHGVGEFRRESDCRKPAPGMLLQASQDLNINLAQSVMVGDNTSDMQAARSAGIGIRCHYLANYDITKLAADATCGIFTLQECIALLSNTAVIKQDGV